LARGDDPPDPPIRAPPARPASLAALPPSSVAPLSPSAPTFIPNDPGRRAGHAHGVAGNRDPAPAGVVDGDEDAALSQVRVVEHLGGGAQRPGRDPRVAQ